MICQKCTCRKRKRRTYLLWWFNKPTWWCGEVDSTFNLKVCCMHTDRQNSAVLLYQQERLVWNEICRYHIYQNMRWNLFHDLLSEVWGSCAKWNICCIGFSLKTEYFEGSHRTYSIIIQVNMVIRNGEFAGSGPYLFQVTCIAYSRLN